jgi:hypothetical protein
MLRTDMRGNEPIAVFFLLSFLSILIGCSSHLVATGKPDPGAISIELIKGVKWISDSLRYDPALPGYRLSGGIGTIRLTRKAGAQPDCFCLEITTSPGNPPNLESFMVACGDTMLHASADEENSVCEILARNAEGLWKSVAEKERDDYFEFTKGNSTVTVLFLKPTLRLMGEVSTVSWIDWYR